MKVLIIEDDNYKSDTIIKAISKMVSAKDVKVCRYRNEGLLELRNNPVYDYLILDMQFPTFSDSPVERDNGLSILAELQRTQNKIPVIICSSSLRDYSEYDFGNVKGYILYDSSTYMTPKFEVLMK